MKEDKNPHQSPKSTNGRDKSGIQWPEIRIALITSILTLAGVISAPYLTGLFQVENTRTLNQGSVDLEKLRFSNDVLKTAFGQSNPAKSLKFYADIGLLEGLNLDEVNRYAELEEKRISEGNSGDSVLPTLLQRSQTNVQVDGDLILALAPNADDEIVVAFTTMGNFILSGFDINKNRRRLSMFLGQVAFETSGFEVLVEQGNYTKERMLQIFPGRIDEAKAREFEHQPEKFLNFIYAGRMGNGPEASGDGWNYRGRGFIGLTGKANYVRTAQTTGIDFVKQPELVSIPYVSLFVAAIEWQLRGLNEIADTGDITLLTKKLTGSLYHLDTRKAYTDRAFELLTAN